MKSLVDMWKENKNEFNNKKLKQIISFAGDGEVDHEETSKQMRSYFHAVESERLCKYIDECLFEKFEKSGFVLQDLINEVGIRLDFKVLFGRYRGLKGKNGYDGVWSTDDNYSIVVEVKTTDAYRINLDTLNTYKSMLLNDGQISKENSSILIVSGREDTGGLEAQIRGSKYAWSIRLISVDSLIKILTLKEKFNDNKTIKQIYEVLKPQEYTRIDKLIDLIFLTAKDIELDEEIVQEEQEKTQTKNAPANFHKDCVKKIQVQLNISLNKIGKTTYGSEKDIGLVVSVSKKYFKGKREHFWFAFHPYFESNLSEYKQKYIAYGCGENGSVFLIPLEMLNKHTKDMWKTEKDSRFYWHINIYKETDGKYYLHVPNSSSTMIELTKYLI